MEELLESQRQKLEKVYVKCTYDNIAEDFSTTRYKKWPKVDAFLKTLPVSNLLLDVGCGNGKYLDNPSLISIGCDVSLNLLKICKTRGFEVVQCDMNRLPFRQTIFDSIICIASLHHVVTSQRRKSCLERMMNLMISSGKLLIQVWSFEQDLDQDNPYLKRNKTAANSDSAITEMMIEDQLRMPVHINKTQFKNQDLLVPFKTKTQALGSERCRETEQFRYYHVFKRGELNSLLENIPDVVILDSYYDRGNWCLIAGKS